MKFENSMNTSFKIVIIGGGTGGLGAGLKDFKDSEKPIKNLITDPDKCLIVKKRASLINPIKQFVKLEDDTQGLIETLGQDGVCSNYSREHVQKTKVFIDGLLKKTNKNDKVNVIFTQPSTPIKCAGAPQKIAYLTEEFLREKGKKNSFRIMFKTGMDKIFSIDEYAKSLMDICKKRNINVSLNEELIKIEKSTKTAYFKNIKTNEISHFRYELLHVTPPMGPFEFIKKSYDIADDNGYVDVDPYNLKHKRYNNIYSLGDCSSLPTSKTAAAAITQCKVVVLNILKDMTENKSKNNKEIQKNINNGDKLRYEGYTSCPLIVGRTQLIMAEFSGYTKELMETFPINQRKPNMLMYAINSKAIPELYWNFYLKGLWHGPKAFRNLLKIFKK